MQAKENAKRQEMQGARRGTRETWGGQEGINESGAAERAGLALCLFKTLHTC